MSILWVLVGGAVGAPLRYLLDLAITARLGSRFPWGTWVVNVLGSLVLGAVAGATVERGAPQWLLTLVGTGGCGALTTFSTMSFETVRLIETGRAARAAAYVGSSVVVGLAACAAGWALVAGL